VVIERTVVSRYKFVNARRRSCNIKKDERIIGKKTDFKALEASMALDKLVFRIAGIFIVLSLLLSQVHSVYWLVFTGFVGLNMIQASYTGFCPMAILLKKIVIKPGCAFE